MKRTRKRLLLLVVFVGTILLIPLVAMQFTDGVDWGSGDFILAGILLLVSGLVIELFIRSIPNKLFRGILIALLILCLLLLWAELAVGLFGSPIAGD